MKFDFSKSQKDLQNKSSIKTQDLVLKNILHLTYQMDSMRTQINGLEEKVIKIVNAQELQTQVDDYFDQHKLDDK